MQSKEDEYRLDEERRQQQSAADMIRNKLSKLYDDEPDAKEEMSEVSSQPDRALSKHQLYMKQLSSSGKSLAEIQVAWHEYYSQLPDTEKHEVWQEFYAEHQRAKEQEAAEKAAQESRKRAAARAARSRRSRTQTRTATSHSKSSTTKETPSKAAPVSHNTAAARRKGKASRITSDLAAAKDIKQHLLSQVQSRKQITKNPHARALVFGLSMGALTLMVLLFGFFNERFITPFIRPNANVSATPIIVDPQATGPVGPESKIIIPKINVEAPVVYDVPTIEEKAIQKGLENGAVHYPTTPNPGEKGNAVIFGHSSSNILNKGKYKFVFLMLKSLEKDDTFIIQKDGKRYVYKVYNEFVTTPDDFSVLNSTDKPATVTLITCDPPGTSTNRLIVQAEQIFPDPSTNAENSVKQDGSQLPKQLPSNSETLWSRFTGWLL